MGLNGLRSEDDRPGALAGVLVPVDESFHGAVLLDSGASFHPTPQSLALLLHSARGDFSCDGMYPPYIRQMPRSAMWYSFEIQAEHDQG